MVPVAPPAPPTVVPAPDLAPRLREALTDSSYTYDAVGELLGSQAHAALLRNETTPALRRTTEPSPLATLVRLFLLQASVDRDAADRALPGLVEPLAAGGMLVGSGGEVRARLDCRPYADDAHDWWVVSDLTPGLDGQPIRVEADHVLGVTPASTSLARLTTRAPVRRALDLGTGCGVQSLHLSTHAETVVATDVTPRALAVTGFNAALNGVTIDVRAGSLWEPVAGETFDLVTSNPPFVISPATTQGLVYRDSGLPGDQVVEAIVRGVPAHLAPGAWCHVVANWAIHEGRPWDERVATWLTDDCDALVVQRDVLDPASYVELWLKDAGRHGTAGYLEGYDAWLAWFESEGIEGVGFGWVNVRRGGSARELLDWPYAVEQPIAPAVAEWARDRAATLGDDTRLVLRPDVVQETRGRPGAEDPEVITLRRQRGLRRARQVDTVEAALAGACDGDLTVGQILDALSQLLGRDRVELRATYLPAVRRLVDEGFLAPG
jgi:methylase of polypeptide subunit release factors